MKPVILILLAAVFAQAQTVADAARRERARQAQIKTTKVFTTEDVKSKNSSDKETQEAAKPVKNAPPEVPGAAPANDPFQKWTEETAKLRTEIRDLMDQEMATQVEMNAASAQINAPVTTQSKKDQAQRTLTASQQKLLGIRSELTKVRSDLQEKDLQSPPPKK